MKKNCDAKFIDATFSILPPIGLDRSEAAAYVRAGTTLFDQMVADGRMPQPRLMNSRIATLR